MLAYDWESTSYYIMKIKGKRIAFHYFIYVNTLLCLILLI